MISALEAWDQKLFRWINDCHHPVADYVFAVLSTHWFIAAIVVLLFVFPIYIKYQRPRVWMMLLLVILCFFCADRLSVIAFKDVFCRLRPCHELPDVRVLRLENFSLTFGICGGKYGFVSSHAANVCAIATAFILLFRRHRTYVFLVSIWAVLVLYSRVYCGVHYPGDVIGGGILGMLIGGTLFVFLRWLMQKFPQSKSEKGLK